ncbi:rRNA-processing protein FCF1 like protein [Cucumispora dikerogammari]|nr:rRNA-processing protein FCF1 like protein [Cucumispora dikerogammari]
MKKPKRTTQIKRPPIPIKPKNTTTDAKQLKMKKKELLVGHLEKQKVYKNRSITTYKPPYQVLLDTNFLLLTIKKKLSLSLLSTKTFLSNIVLNVPDCVIGELEKLKNFLAIKVLKSFNHNKLVCDHKGSYVDDCIIERCNINPGFIVATCDRELRNRLRNQNTPAVFIKGFKYFTEGVYLS